jgi:hypothetical protein
MLEVVKKNEYKELKSLILGVESGQAKFLNLMVENFGNVYARLDRLEENKADKQDVQKLLDAMDASTKLLSDQKQEHDMLTGQVARHDGWIKKIAKKTDVKLDY